MDAVTRRQVLQRGGTLVALSALSAPLWSQAAALAAEPALSPDRAATYRRLVEVLGATTLVSVPEGGVETALAGLTSYYAAARPDVQGGIDRALDAARDTLGSSRASDRGDAHRRLGARSANEDDTAVFGGPVSEAVAMAAAPFVSERGVSTGALFPVAA